MFLHTEMTVEAFLFCGIFLHAFPLLGGIQRTFGDEVANATDLTFRNNGLAGGISLGPE